VKNAILDGEALALDKTGQPQFTDLIREPTALAYAAFDLLWLNGRDLRPLPLSRRKAELATVIPTPGAQVFRVFTVDERGRDLFEAVQRTDFEGIVAKRRVDPYAPGTVWCKVKNPRYTQAPGRGDLFVRPHSQMHNGPQRLSRPAPRCSIARRPVKAVRPPGRHTERSSGSLRRARARVTSPMIPASPQWEGRGAGYRGRMLADDEERHNPAARAATEPPPC
jgi:ATP dependent DNA ligase domain